MKKKSYTEKNVPPESDYKFVEEYIAKTTNPLEAIRCINWMAEHRKKRDRRRKK